MTQLAQRTTTFRPLYTATRWETVAASMRAAVPDTMTNAEATSLIREWSDVSSSSSKLWYQLAAAAYGWDPPKRDYLRRDAEQAAGSYPHSDDAWSWIASIARELDDIGDMPPRISVNRDTFTDPTFYGAVRAALQADGADAAFKIPTGRCIDKKTGKSRIPLPPCDSKGRGPYVGMKNGKPIYAACDKPGDCPAELVDDPVTHAGNQLATLLLIGVVAWFAFTDGR